MRITTREAGEVTIIDIDGELELGNVDRLRNAGRSALEHGARKLLLNLARVTAIDEAGIDELRSLGVAASRSGAKLRLYGLRQGAVELLAITKLLTVFDTYETEADALASFAA
jgi:anti-sigma B factor antagonist